MESSTVLAFRIFVMLSCLIIVPAAAIFGSAFPDVVKTVLVDRIVEWSTGKAPESKKEEADPVAFGDPAQPVDASANPNTNWEAPRWGTQPTANAAPPAGAPDGAVVPAVAQSMPQPLGTPSNNLPPATELDRAGHPGVPRDRAADDLANRGAGNELAAARTGYGQGGAPPSDAWPVPASAAVGATAAGGARPAAAHTGPTAESPDRFTSMERKLREYGASYYLLETWGNDGELYRFHCRMAINNNPNYTRHFEATDRDPLKAMSQVLERVEAWRAGRLQ